MTTIAPAASDAVAAAIAVVNQIDLSPINNKLQYENPSLWTDEMIAETETDYRRFLALNLLYPTETLSVNKMLDEYWHQHILDTQKYADDCEAIFGYFLHHYPYFGIADEEDRRQNLEAFAVTQQLWRDSFGVSMAGKPKLTLDKVLGGYQSELEGITRNIVYAYPKACKNGQHCKRVIVPNADAQGLGHARFGER